MPLDTLGNNVLAANIIAATAAFIYHIVEGPVRRWKPTKRWFIFVLFGTLTISLEIWLALLRGPLAGKLYRPPAATGGSNRHGAAKVQS